MSVIRNSGIRDVGTKGVHGLDEERKGGSGHEKKLMIR